MNIILNIGLDGIPADLSYTNGVLNPLNVRRALQAVQAVRAHGFNVLRAKVMQSDTKPTLVVEVAGTEPTLVVEVAGTAAGQDNRLHMLSVALHQDCIGVWYPDESWGQRVGPRADAWGDFNPKFFIMPDGTRPEEA